MPKKLDRFERLLDGERLVPVKVVLKLLRAEHAWMRRQIEQIDRTRLRKDPDTPPNIQVGIAAALDDLERRLDQRRK